LLVVLHLRVRSSESFEIPPDLALAIPTGAESTGVKSMKGSAAVRTPADSMLRLIVGYGAIVCAVPYLALKIVWLTGGDLGVADAAMMHDASMVALNVATAGMDLVAIAIALAFTHAWGQRIPAWLVLPPTWVALGLLTRFVLAAPLAAIAGMLTTRSTPRASGPVQPWVYPLVYTEFVGMGIGLTLAFVFYARVRWSSVFQSTTRTASPDATRRVQVPLANRPHSWQPSWAACISRGRWAPPSACRPSSLPCGLSPRMWSMRSTAQR
jgi:hypothetical protein